MVVSKNVLKQLKKTSKGAWKKARKTEVSVDAELPEGAYVCKVSSCNVKLSKEQVPFVSIGLVVVEPEEYEGKRKTKMHFLQEKGKKSLLDSFEWLSQDLQRLGIETKDLSEEELLEACEALGEEKPLCKISIQDNPGYQQKVYINNLVDELEDEEEDELEDEEEEEDEGEDEEGEDEDEEEEEDETEEEDDEEEDEDSLEDEYEDLEEEEEKEEEKEKEEEEEEEEYWQPYKEEIYKYRPKKNLKKAACTVTSINKTKETCNLKRNKDGKVFKAIPWDKLED